MTGRPAEYAALTTDDLVTGEAVALDLPPASLAARAVSGLIDLVVTLILFIVGAVVAVVTTIGTDEALFAVGSILAIVFALIVVPTTIETLTRGRTLGKLAMGLRTVRDDAGPITFQHAFVRSLVGVVEIYLTQGVPAFFSSMLSQRGKRLGDYAAGTYVVRDRIRLVLPPPVAMPPVLWSWATTADIAPLPTGLALGVRQFLGRLGDITPASRAALGARLAEQVLEYVAPPPPRGTPPEAMLAAVIAARRDRDAERLRREERLRARLTRVSRP